MSGGHVLDSMFHPKSVAIVGASANSSRGGTRFLARLRKLDFQGRLYPVNPKETEIQRLQAYADVHSLPEPPDLVIIAIPSPAVPRVLEDCVAIGVRNVHIFSAGFAETGLEEGRLLDERITDIIRDGGINVVGPNCMGLYVPSSRLAYWGALPAGVGRLAFLSQSGGHAEMLSTHAQELGVYFSKIISFGNARGLQAIDFLEYLAQDTETDIIAIYLEGISDGSRFTQLVREVNRVKPVMVWKGGLTESGSRAVASHTGSLAGESRVWDAFYAQTGAVRVTSREEIVDVAMAFLRLEPPRGRRVLLVGGGGGNSVAMADVCSREGLEVPPLGEDTRRELNTFISLAGNSARNPIDAFMLLDNVEVFGRGMELAAGDPAIDAVILDRFIRDDSFQDETDIRDGEAVDEYVIESALDNRFGKPVLVALNARGIDPAAASLAARFWQRCALAGVATYANQAAASRALSLFIGYHEYQARHR